MVDANALSGRSSLSFGIRSESKSSQHVQKQSRKLSIVAVSIIISVIMVMICLLVLDLYNNTPANSNRKNTSVLREHLEELLKMQQPLKIVHNVDIQPQDRADVVDEVEQTSPKNTDEVKIFANHRYYSGDQVEPRMGLKPKPFTMESAVVNKTRPVNSIQDILAQDAKDPYPISPPRSFSGPLRFRGFYLEPQESENQGERNENYFKRINQYFAVNQPKDNVSHRGHMNNNNGAKGEYGAASDLYTQAFFHPHNSSTIESPLEKNWNPNRPMHKRKKKPFTVMLDIYPMPDEDTYTAPTQHLPMHQNYLFQPPGRIPPSLYNHGKRISATIGMPSRTKKRKNRMLMKLNLFPRGVDERERRTWGGSSDTAQYEGGCQILGHNPKGKPISAKWKDANGDVIHAKVVTLKQMDERIDHDQNHD